MVRPVVHSTKHYVQNSLATIAAGAQLVLTLVDSVAVVNKNASNEVEEGAIIKACYIEEWIRSPEASPGSFIAVLWKQPGGASNFTTVEMAALHNAEAKKNILWSSQGLINDTDADALGLSRGWYKIPKSKQRFGLGDKLLFQVFAQGAIDIVICGLATYKEYT